MTTTKIELTDKTWNPVTGCTTISSGCAHCYAEIMAHRLKAMGQEKYIHKIQSIVSKTNLNTPLEINFNFTYKHKIHGEKNCKLLCFVILLHN